MWRGSTQQRCREPAGRGQAASCRGCRAASVRPAQAIRAEARLLTHAHPPVCAKPLEHTSRLDPGPGLARPVGRSWTNRRFSQPIPGAH